MPKVELIASCKDAIQKNTAKLNLGFLKELSSEELEILKEKLNAQHYKDNISQLTKLELHRLVNPNKHSYFYSDNLSKSMIIDGPLSPMVRANKIGQGKYGDVFKFESRTRDCAVKYGRVRHSHLDQEHIMSQKAGIKSHFFSHEDQPTRFCSPFVSGQPLIKLLRSRKLQLQQWLEISVRIAEAITCLHKKGIVHNDITPFNILVEKNLDITIIDYGESHKDIALKRVDIYAFSNMLVRKFELIAKREPSETVDRIINKLNETLDNPDAFDLDDFKTAIETSADKEPLKASNFL